MSSEMVYWQKFTKEIFKKVTEEIFKKFTTEILKKFAIYKEIFKKFTMRKSSKVLNNFSRKCTTIFINNPRRASALTFQ